MGKKSYLALLARLRKGAHKQEGECGNMSSGSIQGWEKPSLRFVGVLLGSENKLQVKSKLLIL